MLVGADNGDLLLFDNAGGLVSPMFILRWGSCLKHRFVWTYLNPCWIIILPLNKPMKNSMSCASIGKPKPRPSATTATTDRWVSNRAAHEPRRAASCHLCDPLFEGGMWRESNWIQLGSGWEHRSFGYFESEDLKILELQTGNIDLLGHILNIGWKWIDVPCIFQTYLF